MLVIALCSRSRFPNSVSCWSIFFMLLKLTTREPAYRRGVLEGSASFSFPWSRRRRKGASGFACEVYLFRYSLLSVQFVVWVCHWLDLFLEIKGKLTNTIFCRKPSNWLVASIAVCKLYDCLHDRYCLLFPFYRYYCHNNRGRMFTKPRINLDNARSPLL